MLADTLHAAVLRPLPLYARKKDGPAGAHLWCLCFLSAPACEPSSAYVYGIHWIFIVTLLGGRMLVFSHIATCQVAQ